MIESVDVNVNTHNSLEAVNATEESCVHFVHALLFVDLSFYDVVSESELEIVCKIRCNYQMFNSGTENH